METEKKASELISYSIKKKIEENIEEIKKLNIEKLELENLVYKNKILLDSYLKEQDNKNLKINKYTISINELEEEIKKLKSKNSTISNEITLYIMNDIVNQYKIYLNFVKKRKT